MEEIKNIVAYLFVTGMFGTLFVCGMSPNTTMQWVFCYTFCGILFAPVLISKSKNHYDEAFTKVLGFGDTCTCDCCCCKEEEANT